MRSVKKERNLFLDILKGLTMIFVIFGHSIQFGSGHVYLENELFYENPVFKIIYSFHMPLFALISGYLFYHSTQKNSFKEIVFQKIKTLLLPTVASSIFYYFIMKFIFGESLSLFNTLLSFLWFLWAIFFSSVAVGFVSKLCKDHLSIYLLSFVLLFVTPDLLGLNNIKFIYFFFTVGYLFHRFSQEKNFSLEKKEGYVFAGSFLLFLLLIPFYHRGSYIYGNPLFIFDSSSNPVSILIGGGYRFTIGIVGSVMVASLSKILFYDLSCKKIKDGLLLIGQNTMGIYILQSWAMSFLPKIFDSLDGVHYFVVGLNTIFILLLCLLFCSLLKKNKRMNKIFLGGRY